LHAAGSAASGIILSRRLSAGWGKQQCEQEKNG
jgi:hypothetical protein